MSISFLKYITLGFEVLNAVTTIIAMVRIPMLLSAQAVWISVHPVLAEIEQVAGVKINMTLAEAITADSVNAIKAALTPKVA